MYVVFVSLVFVLFFSGNFYVIVITDIPRKYMEMKPLKLDLINT